MTADVAIVAISATPTSQRGRLVFLDLAWPAKAPADTVVVGIDFGGVLMTALGSLTLLSATVAATGCIAAVQTVTGTVVSVQVAGGRDGEIATVRIMVTASDGSVRAATVLLPIVQPVAATLPSGVGYVPPTVLPPVVTALTGTINAPQVAIGTTQTTAAAIMAGLTVFAGGNGGGVLPTGSGQRCEVLNRTGATLLIYPPAGGSIEGAGVNSPARLENGVSAVFASYDGLAWTAH